MLLDRQPERRVGRVVDDDDALEIRVFEARDRIERLLEHLRRLVMRRNVDRHFRRGQFGRERRRSHQPQRLAAEGDGGDFLDARERDDDQRDQQHGAQAQCESGARHEVVAVPIGEHGGKPGAHHIGAGRKQRGLSERHRGHGEDRQRQQHAHQQRDAGEPPVVGLGERAGPVELGLARSVEQTPIGADAAFENLPGLIDRFDDVVVDAVGARARDEVAQDGGLFDAAGVGILQIIAGARPAELGDHDALAGIGLAQLVVDQDSLVDGLRVREAFPVGQHVRGDVVDRRNQLGMRDPDVPDFAGGDGHAGRALHALDHLDEVVGGLLAAEDRFVADHHAFDVAVAAGEVDRRVDLALVAVLVLVDPGADGDVQAEFGGDARHKLDAAGRRIEADRAGDRRELLQIGADLLRRRLAAFVGINRTGKRGVGHAGKRAFDVRRADVRLR